MDQPEGEGRVHAVATLIQQQALGSLEALPELELSPQPW
jgi:hypothetical protein